MNAASGAPSDSASPGANWKCRLVRRRRAASWDDWRSSNSCGEGRGAPGRFRSRRHLAAASKRGQACKKCTAWAVARPQRPASLPHQLACQQRLCPSPSQHSVQAPPHLHRALVEAQLAQPRRDASHQVRHAVGPYAALALRGCVQVAQVQRAHVAPVAAGPGAQGFQGGQVLVEAHAPAPESRTCTSRQDAGHGLKR
jgi:hypothetical protein